MKRAALSAVVLLLVTSATAAAQTIVVDPGHGGTDPGGTGTGLQEKNIVLDVSLKLRDLLDADTADAAGGGAWTVHITRDDDAFVSLSARAAYANSVGADRFLSIHSNAFADPSANGTETFSFSETGQGAALRNLVQEEMIAAWGLRNRGNKTANFAVLRETAMPAELHELAFITNATDAAKLASAGERLEAAEAHLRALQRHYGIAPYIPGTAPEPADDGAVEGVVSGPAGPLAGASVSLDGEAAATTADDGTFQITGVPAGDHIIAAAADGHIAADAAIAVTGDQTVSVDLFLEAEADTDPPRPGDDGGDGDPPAGEQPDQDNTVVGGCAVAGAGELSTLPLVFATLAALGGCRRRRRSRP